MSKQKIDETNSIVLLRTSRNILIVDGNQRVAALQSLLAIVTPDRPDEADRPDLAGEAQNAICGTDKPDRE
jgi:hypothetical protein